MGYMLIEIKRDDAPAVSYHITISDADISRILSTHAEIYFPNGVIEPDPNGVPEIGSDGAPIVPMIARSPTSIEVLNEAARRIVSDMTHRAIVTETENARLAAAASIQPINVTEL